MRSQNISVPSLPRKKKNIFLRKCDQLHNILLFAKIQVLRHFLRKYFFPPNQSIVVGRRCVCFALLISGIFCVSIWLGEVGGGGGGVSQYGHFEWEYKIWNVKVTDPWGTSHGNLPSLYLSSLLLFSASSFFFRIKIRNYQIGGFNKFENFRMPNLSNYEKNI